MNKTGTILKAMQAVLLVTVLTPAISHADPLSTRMMLAQAQTQSQDQAVKGEVKKMNRGLILGTAEAATNPNLQRPVEIPQVTAPVTTAPVASTPVATVEAPQIEIPALPPRNYDAPVAPVTSNTFSTDAAPATATSTPSVVTLPAPQPASDTAVTVTKTPATTDVVTTPAPVTPVEPVTVATPTPVTTSTVTTTTDTAKTDTAKAGTTSVKPTSTRTAQVSSERHGHTHSDDSINVGGVKLNGGNLNVQISNIMNRSDVKSILSQYGLN